MIALVTIPDPEDIEEEFEDDEKIEVDQMPLEHKDVEQEIEYVKMLLFYPANTALVVLPKNNATQIFDAWKDFLSEKPDPEAKVIQYPLIFNENKEYGFRLDSILGITIMPITPEEPDEDEEENDWNKRED